jgi:stage II sporulation protein M
MPLLRLLWGGWRWILASVLLFCLSALAGWWAAQSDPERMIEALRPVFQQLGGLGARVGGSESPVERWWLIYRNNARAVSIMMACGLIPVFGAIFPAFAMVVNGALLGVVVGLGTRLSPRAADPAQLVLGLAPHGVFELPAIWLAGAWAMRLALSWLAPGDFEARWDHVKRTAREAIIVLGVAIALLLVAAAIEGNITLALVRRGQTT